MTTTEVTFTRVELALQRIVAEQPITLQGIGYLITALVKVGAGDSSTYFLRIEDGNTARTIPLEVVSF